MQFLSNKCLTEASANKETNVHHTDHDVIGLIPSMLRCRGDDTNGVEINGERAGKYSKFRTETCKMLR